MEETNNKYNVSRDQFIVIDRNKKQMIKAYIAPELVGEGLLIVGEPVQGVVALTRLN